MENAQIIYNGYGIKYKIVGDGPHNATYFIESISCNHEGPACQLLVKRKKSKRGNFYRILKYVNDNAKFYAYHHGDIGLKLSENENIAKQFLYEYKLISSLKKV